MASNLGSGSGTPGNPVLPNQGNVPGGMAPQPPHAGIQIPLGQQPHPGLQPPLGGTTPPGGSTPPAGNQPIFPIQHPRSGTPPNVQQVVPVPVEPQSDEEEGLTPVWDHYKLRAQLFFTTLNQ